VLDLARAWLDKKPVLQRKAFTIEYVPFKEDDGSASEDIDEVESHNHLIFNGRVALVQDNWGHKAGQIAFGVYEKDDTGWDRVSNHDVEWRTPKREPKTPEQLEAAYTKAFNEAMVQVVATLLETC